MAVNPDTPLPERRASVQLLQHADLMPQHMRSQFFQNPKVSAVSLVDRLKRLADVNPDFRKAAKPLLDNLQNFFSLEEPKYPVEEEGLGQVAEQGLLPPQEQARQQLAKQPKPGQAEQQVPEGAYVQVALWERFKKDGFEP